MRFALPWQSIRRAVVAASLLTTAALAGGCIVDNTSSAPAAASGTLVVTWDIQGSIDPSACTSHVASTLQFRVYDATNAQVGNAYQQACSAFATTLPVGLSPGTYSLEAELLDSTGTARTTTVGAAPAAAVTFSIYDGQTTTVPITFPDSSFK